MDKETRKKIEEFFDRNIEPKAFGLYMRRYRQQNLRMYLTAEDPYIIDRYDFSEGDYFLNELCEILDPQLGSNLVTEDES